MSVKEAIYENLDPSDVLFCDRSGNIISIYCKDNFKIQFIYDSVEKATRNLTKFRKELEGVKVGD